MEITGKLKKYLEDYIDNFFELASVDGPLTFSEYFKEKDIYKWFRSEMHEKFSSYFMFIAGNPKGTDWFEDPELFKSFDPRHNYPTTLYKNHLDYVTKSAEYLTFKAEEAISFEESHKVVPFNWINTETIQFDMEIEGKDISFTLNPDDLHPVSADNSDYVFDPKYIAHMDKNYIYIEKG